MALLRRNQPSELPESQVEYRESSNAKRWLTLLIYIVVALAVAVLVVLAGRWLYHQVHDTSSPNPAPVAPKSTDQGKKAAPNSSSGSKPGSNQSGGSKSGGTSSNNGNKPAPSPGALPNNGPGDVIALFIGSSLAAAGLHYAIALRRANKLT